MCHGDERGLRLPPAIAPIQVVVLVIRNEPDVRAAADQLARDLRAAGVRAELDDRTDVSFGRRAIDWEIKGVPLRVEVGPRDLANGEITLVRRDLATKENMALGGLAGRIPALLTSIQSEMLTAARASREARTIDVSTLEEAQEAAASGFARIPWANVGLEGENTLRAATVTVRCLQGADGGLPVGDADAGAVAYVARAY